MHYMMIYAIQKCMQKYAIKNMQKYAEVRQ